MPARDPFYRTRAAEIAANIMLAELETFRNHVFRELDSLCTGEVVAVTKAGNQLLLEWDVEHQCIRTVQQNGAPVVGQEVRLCA